MCFLNPINLCYSDTFKICLNYSKVLQNVSVNISLYRGKDTCVFSFWKNKNVPQIHFHFARIFLSFFFLRLEKYFVCHNELLHQWKKNQNPWKKCGCICT